MERSHDDATLMAIEEKVCAQGTGDYLSGEVTKIKQCGIQLADRFYPKHKDSYITYHKALVLALQVDPLIVAQVANLDFLREPETDDAQADVNYAQLLTLDEDGTSSIRAVLSFMVDLKDRTGEPYDHSPVMQQAIRDTLERIADEHHTASAYFKVVSRRLWRRRNYLANLMHNEMVLMDLSLTALVMGMPCVFDHFDENDDPVFV